MIDSVALWATQLPDRLVPLRPDGPPAARGDGSRCSARVDAAAGRHVNLIGEGWNFGEVADGKRFVQASQLSLDGSRHRHLQRPRARRAARRRLPATAARRCVDNAGLPQRPGLRAQRARRGKRTPRRPAARRRPGARRPGRHAARLPHARPPTAATSALARDRLQAASPPATPRSRAKSSTTSRTTTTRPCSTSTPASCRATPRRADRARVQLLGAALDRLQPGRRLLPCRHRHAALEVAGPQQLRFRRLVQSPRLELPGQLLRHRPAAAAGQRQGLGADAAAAGRCRASSRRPPTSP